MSLQTITVKSALGKTEYTPFALKVIAKQLCKVNGLKHFLGYKVEFNTALGSARLVACGAATKERYKLFGAAELVELREVL